ncbi:uncharacterized protein LOC125810407 [Solanum verrucosum]|uniref:uncharacterized protein LOC125810407 n=1 Tax=Solanum verrucosum TaxID=315347 RepID=UPI0020D1A874|nr:uncharacterized protein LOC125810407 [Solanum verrucosum]
MDPKYAGETFKHLEKESELLSNAHKAMSDELHRLQVEEEMLMRKLHELISHTLTKKKGLNDNAEERQNDREGARVDMTTGADERQNDQEGALVDMTNGADGRQNDLEGAVIDMTKGDH